MNRQQHQSTSESAPAGADRSADVNWETLVADLKQGSTEWFQLVQTEAQLLIDTLSRLQAISLSMASIAVTGWIALLATLGAVAWRQGIAPEFVFGGATLICIVAVGILRRHQRALMKEISFAASLRQLGLIDNKAEKAERDAQQPEAQPMAASQTQNPGGSLH